MKKIFFPTDFSENAENALNYAVEMAQLLNAKLLLFHAYELPYSTHTMSTTLLSLMRQEAEKQLKKCVSQLAEKATNLEVETVLREGNTIRSIIEASEQKGADVIIMGTKGASGLKEMFIGSQTASVMQRARIPVLVIPEDAQFRPIDKLVYASDMLDRNELQAIGRLKDFAQSMNAEILVLHVKNLDIKPEGSLAYLEANLADVQHSFHLESNDDIEEGIRRFVDDKGADILAMLSRKHTMFDLLFNPVRLTKRMAYHPDLPLLILHEEEARV